MSIACSFSGVYFDGIDDYLYIPDTASLDITGNITMTAWIKLDRTTHDKNTGIICKYLGSSNQRSYLLGIDWQTDNNNPRLSSAFSDNGLYQANNTVSSVTIMDQQWHHVAAVFSPGQSSILYIDGIENNRFDSGLSGSIYNGSAQLWVGKQYSLSDGTTFSGIINESAVWATALSSNEIYQLSHSRLKRLPLQIQTDYLRGYWPMDDHPSDTSGDTLLFSDYSSNRNMLTGTDGTDNTGLTMEAEEVLTYP